MKKSLLVSLFVSFVLLSFSQNPRVPFPASLRHIAVAEYPTEKSGTYNQTLRGLIRNNRLLPLTKKRLA